MSETMIFIFFPILKRYFISFTLFLHILFVIIRYANNMKRADSSLTKNAQKAALLRYPQCIFTVCKKKKEKKSHHTLLLSLLNVVLQSLISSTLAA